MAEAKLDTRIRREQIAEAAMAHIAAHGLRRLSMAAVARRVGLVPSAIYRHFKNKEELIDAVLDRVEGRLVANVEAARAGSGDAAARLKDVLMRHVRFIREGRALPRIVFSDDLHAEQPARRARLTRVFHRYRDLLMQLVREGQAEGQFARGVDPETAAMFFLGMVIPAGVLWHVTEGRFDVTRHAARVWPMFCRALTAEEGRT